MEAAGLMAGGEPCEPDKPQRFKSSWAVWNLCRRGSSLTQGPPCYRPLPYSLFKNARLPGLSCLQFSVKARKPRHTFCPGRGMLTVCPGSFGQAGFEPAFLLSYLAKGYALPSCALACTIGSFGFLRETQEHLPTSPLPIFTFQSWAVCLYHRPKV